MWNQILHNSLNCLTVNIQLRRNNAIHAIDFCTDQHSIFLFISDKTDRSVHNFVLLILLVVMKFYALYICMLCFLNNGIQIKVLLTIYTKKKW